MLEPDIIPWKTKNEWVSVYEDAYSGIYERVSHAYEVLKNWQSFMRRSYRPGMECTSILLQPFLSDSEMFPDTKNPLEDKGLQVMYSAGIMRILNVISDPLRGGKRKTSIYGNCRDMGIPDWIINIRNQMAHGNIYPELGMLRMAAKFLLDWLKYNYWEVEKSGMKDVILEDVEKVINEKLGGLLRVYIHLQEQSMLGFSRVRDIQDPDVREAILEMDSFRAVEVRVACRPWDVRRSPELSRPEPKRLKSLPTKAAVARAVSYLREFLYDDFYQVDTLNLLTNIIIEDSTEHNMVRTDIWNTLLKSVHSWGKFPRLIVLFISKTSCTMAEKGHYAGSWALDLCHALEKRYKVELLNVTLLKEPTAKKKQKNLLSLLPAERQQLVQLLFKRRLKINPKMENKTFACLLVQIEKKNPHLRKVIRLKEAKFPLRSEVLTLIKTVALYPSEFSENCIISLLQILKRPFHTKYQKRLLKLHRLYKGDKLNFAVKRKSRKIYDVHDLVKTWAQSE